MSENDWIDPGEPCRGDVLRLVLRIPGQKDFVQAYPCFYRLEKDQSLTQVWLWDGTRLQIACACHKKERLATFHVRHKQQPGYPSYSTLLFKNKKEIVLEKFRSRHSAVKARVIRVPTR